MVAAPRINTNPSLENSGLVRCCEKNGLDQSAHVDTHAKPTSKSLQQPRTVRFSLVEDVKTFTTPRDQCKKSDLYWSAKERTRLHIRARQDCAVIRGSQLERIKELEVAYAHGGDTAVSKDQRRNDLRAIFEWTKSDGRGLERGISSAFSHKDHVKKVVKLHKNLVSLHSCAAGGSVDAANALGAFCRLNTSMSTEFAYRLGLGDACCVWV